MRIRSRRLLFLLFVTLILVNLISVIIFQVKGQQEIPVSIDKNRTRFVYGKTEFSKTAELTVAIKNYGKNDTLVTLRVHGENLEIFPEGNKTANLPGESTMSTTNFGYFITSNKTGEFHVIVELWYQEQLIDFHPLLIEFHEPSEPINIIPKNLSLYQLQLFFIYVLAGFSIILIYIKTFTDWSFNKYYWILGIFLVAAYLAITPVSRGLESLISQSEGKVEPILVIILFLSIGMIISLIGKLGGIRKISAYDYSLVLANISLFLLPLPLIFNWIMPPDWVHPYLVLINIAISLVFTYVLHIISEKKTKK